VVLGYTRPVALESPPIASMGKNCDGPAGELGAFHELVARAWERGAAIDWRPLVDERARRIPLPTYPFEGKRAWIDPPRETARRATEVEAPAAHAGGNGVSHAPAGNGQVAPRNGDHAPGNGAAVQVVSAAPLLQAEITVHPDRIVIRTGAGQAAQTAVVDIAAAAAIAASIPQVVPQVVSASSPPPPVKPAAPPPVAARQADPPPAAPKVEPPAADDVEAKIAELVEELLGITEIPRDAKLVDLGADSLMLTQLLTRLRKAVWPGLTMKILTESGSIAGIARLARGGTPAPTPAAAPAANSDPSVDDLVESLKHLSPDELARELARLEEDDDDDDR
jgi:acyl transferase domain-containing protein